MKYSLVPKPPKRKKKYGPHKAKGNIIFFLISESTSPFFFFNAYILLFSSTNKYSLPTCYVQALFFLCQQPFFLKLNICYPVASFYTPVNLNFTHNDSIKMSSVRSPISFKCPVQMNMFQS